MELSLGWNGFTNSELRRWQPDPLSAMLWAGTPADAANDFLAPETTPSGAKKPSDAAIFKRFGKQFRAFLKSEETAGIEGLESVLQASYAVAHTQIPPIIVRYASREIVSHSLTRAALTRFAETRVPCGHSPAVDLANNETASSQPRRKRSDDPLWLQTVLETIESRKAKQGLERLSKESELQLVRVFADFALWLLSVSSPSGTKYTAKATIELVGVLGRYLGPFLEDVNPIGQDAESMTELYWQAMEATGPASFNRTLKGDLSRAMREFDRYLSEFRDPGEGAKPKFPWFPSGLADVDANPASHEDYHRLLTRIEQEWPVDEPWETREIAWLLVVLGFRCGLRRLEALYLQVEDVLVRGRGELFVRPTQKRKLKSLNAQRRIPLGVFLTPGEFDRLQKWKEHRISNPAVVPTDCLFGIVERDLTLPSEHVSLNRPGFEGKYSSS